MTALHVLSWLCVAGLVWVGVLIAGDFRRHRRLERLAHEDICARNRAVHGTFSPGKEGQRAGAVAGRDAAPCPGVTGREREPRHCARCRHVRLLEADSLICEPCKTEMRKGGAL